LKIYYKSFKDEDYHLIFHPYYLKQYNNRWFVFGMHAEYKEPCWNLPLDRIMTLEEIDSGYTYTDIDWEDYFYDIIGVTKPADCKIEEVELIFSKEQAKYISTKPLHPSQKSTILVSGELQVKLRIIPNYELEMKILSFGEKVRVIHPTELQNRIVERLELAYKSYL
jgi:predicted DNA-binding transcriptional regulator YafY